MTQTVILYSDKQRKIARDLLDKCGDYYIVTFSPPRRSLSQNRKLYAMLSDVSRAKPEGRVMTPENWKAAFMSALGHEILWQQGIDGSPPFPAGFRSSRLTVSQMADLITFIQEYGDRHGVDWQDENRN